MKTFKTEVLIGILSTLLLMVMPLPIQANGEGTETTTELKETTYQFTINQSAQWTPVPLAQKPGALKLLGFQYQPKVGTGTIFLRIAIYKNTDIWSKQSFPRLLWRIAKKQHIRNIYAQAYSQDNVREILATSTQQPPSLYYDLNKAMAYGFSQTTINRQIYNVSNFVLVGKDSIVSLTFLCLPRDYDASLTPIITMADSFRFDENAKLPAQQPWFLQSNILALIFKGGFFLILISIGFGIGTWIEKRHYASIRDREQALIHMPAIPAKLETVMAGSTQTIVRAEMVYGSVVLSEDFFKGFLANLKNFLGGNLTSYESLMDRARREAVLRMKADRRPKNSASWV